MIVTRLKLENFRNYTSCDLEPHPGLNILFGNNGQGKTNIIEAIYMCSCARSHRTARDAELIRHGESFYDINLNYQSSFNEKYDDAYDEQIGILYRQLPSVDNRTKKYERVLTKDNLTVSKTADFVGLFHAVMFAPEDLQLIKEGPAVRRRFIDLLISQISPAYFRNLQVFARLLKQRNSLLKQIRDTGGRADTSTLANQLVIWDMQFANTAALLIKERFQVIDRLAYWASDIHRQISGGAEALRFQYKTIRGLDISTDLPTMEGIIEERLQRSRDEDILKGSTSAGPHRDDFDIVINELPLKSFGSQGQQRTAVLAMKMAELEIIRHATREAPVLLLDDVMSELDMSRREKLVSSLKNVQIFVTCTDPDQLDKSYFDENQRKDARYFKVSAGSVSQLG